MILKSICTRMVIPLKNVDTFYTMCFAELIVLIKDHDYLEYITPTLFNEHRKSKSGSERDQNEKDRSISGTRTFRKTLEGMS